MSLIQFWRILWARKFLILSTTVCCVLGGVAVLMLVPPRWQASAHVYLNLLKPDPVTNEVIAGPSSRSYVATQIDLITDYSVTGPTVDKLGWLSDPDLIQQYQNRSKDDTRDFRRWLAQLIVDRTKADVPDGSNILDITYTGSNPDTAKAVANAVMQSYLDASLAFRRADAIRSADWYDQQAVKAKAQLIADQTAQTNFERQTGVVFTQDDKTDLDSARLSTMAGQSASIDLAGGGGEGQGPIDVQLAETDAAIRQQSAILGPNHPQIKELQAKRALLASLNAQQHAGIPTEGPASRLDKQKALVISERDNLAKLKILQGAVALSNYEYSKSMERAADFRQQAAVADSGLSALGTASVPSSPSFPNKPLIVGGSLGLGLTLGILIALLTELLNRRVRGAEDLRSALNVPLLTVLRMAH